MPSRRGKVKINKESLVFLVVPQLRARQIFQRLNWLRTLTVYRFLRRVGARLRVAQRKRVVVRTSPVAVAQVWRHGSRQTRLARILAGVAAPPLDLDTGRRLGTLLAAAGGQRRRRRPRGHAGLPW